MHSPDPEYQRYVVLDSSPKPPTAGLPLVRTAFRNAKVQQYCQKKGVKLDKNGAACGPPRSSRANLPALSVAGRHWFPDVVPDLVCGHVFSRPSITSSSPVQGRRTPSSIIDQDSILTKLGTFKRFLDSITRSASVPPLLTAFHQDPFQGGFSGISKSNTTLSGGLRFLTDCPWPHWIAALPRTGHEEGCVIETKHEKFRLPLRKKEDFGTYSIILPTEPFVFGVSHITPRTVPEHIVRPHYAVQGYTEAERDGGLEPPFAEKIVLGGEAESRLRAAARLARKVREYAGQLVKVGVTTDSIDAALHDYIIAHSAYPSPLRYEGFPKSVCTSVNNILVHGIPDDRPLENGDIVNIDITVFLNGYHGDTSQTFLVGDVDEQGRELVKVTNAALRAGIQACGPGRPVKGIGKAIHELIRLSNFSVSSQFTGHGIGTVFHRPPWILHHLNDEPGVMMPGDCFTIEPCIVQGANPRGWIFPDGWTASTENCARSAQAEHMVLITDRGAEVLT
ncbi:putative removes the N-terminal methionine from nascent proteins [Lyophyllum shimeji]|uniref:Methionine aminopeptidase n=1 Tax=Lyophyllum shimeji TaxID=47721 RepID=A0A9P3UHN3_LYOSH|nr:putative removes the N-terminal methionine from nascent proteins [Lyophyllum shimeji]